MGPEILRIGSRGSDLALWQARKVKHDLEQHSPALRVVMEIIKTKGDKVLDVPLSGMGDKGLFTRELETALLERKIDLAVHSLKDLPTQLPEGLMLGAVTERENPLDVFIPHPKNTQRTLAQQPYGALVATGSLRRSCQLRQFRDDLQIQEIRGNLDTRFRKLDASEWQGMILARAGVVRLGWEERIGETINPEIILPAVGQGALGVEIRSDDDKVAGVIGVLNHKATFNVTRAERSLLRTLEGGCQIPLGVFGRIAEAAGRKRLVLDAMVGSLDGKRVVRDRAEGDPDEAEGLGKALARQLLSKGADRILREIRGEPLDVKSAQQ